MYNNKTNPFLDIVQGIDDDFLEHLLRVSYDSIRQGSQRALKQIVDNPGEYDFRNAKPVRINSLVKQQFIRNYSNDAELRKKIRWFKSHGVDYFLIDGKFLLCLKRVDKKGRVSSYYSNRFKAILKGEEKVPYSKQMLEQLAQLGLLKPLPIVFVGHTLDKSGLLLEDVKCVNYKDGGLNFMFSLNDKFIPNLFNQNVEKVDKGEWMPEPRKFKMSRNNN